MENQLKEKPKNYRLHLCLDRLSIPKISSNIRKPPYLQSCFSKSTPIFSYQSFNQQALPCSRQRGQKLIGVFVLVEYKKVEKCKHCSKNSNTLIFKLKYIQQQLLFSLCEGLGQHIFPGNDLSIRQYFEFLHCFGIYEGVKGQKCYNELETLVFEHKFQQYYLLDFFHQCPNRLLFT